jgi:gamma-glutamyltranspeptidase/glutathione hydrolase
MRKFTQPGRSMVYANKAAMATSHPLATQVGLDMLRQGGNAVDACIAATAVLSLAEPAMTGIGGDCFALIAKPNEAPIALNGSGFSPAGATIDAARAASIDNIPTHSPWAVTIPGAVAAWHRLHTDYGKLSWQEVLQPAIDYARQGVPVHERAAYDWQQHERYLQQDSDAASLYLNHGKAYQTGEIFQHPKLADSLEQIAIHGPEAFYRGSMAADMVNKLTSFGGIHTLDDFAAVLDNHGPEYVTPTSQKFHDYTLWECPPNGQGITAQVIAAIMAEFNVANLDLLNYHHLLTEASKLAYQVRDDCVSDPSHMPYSNEDILAPEFIQSLVDRIDMQRAQPAPASLFPNHKDTIYLCCVDEDGFSVSFINSIFNPFGSAIACPESGILLQSRGASFNLHEGHVNCLAPDKRPMHTIIPAMLSKHGQLLGPMGVMGGHYQAVGHAHMLNLMQNFAHTPQQALDAPRSFAYEGALTVEDSLPEEVVAGLRAKGHDVVVSSDPIGGGQMILRTENGTLMAASDARKDGLALGY